MPGNLTLSLRTAQSALLTNQSALDTIAKNISNVNTPGYSRKIANFEQRVVNGAGAGVQISSITRSVDEGLLKSLRTELSALNKFNSQQATFLRLQDTFGAPGDNSSISHIMADMQGAMETLALTPEGALEQSELMRWGVEIANTLQTMSATIQDLRLEADRGISEAVTEINSLTANISLINDSIVKAEVINSDTTDLKDQRDQNLTRLSELIDIEYFVRNDGDMIVFAGGGQTLVDASSNELLYNPASFVSASTTKAEGNLSGIYANTIADNTDISGSLGGGVLAGYVEMRDNSLPNLQSQLDELASEMRDVFNQIHNSGVAFPGLQTMSGTRDFLDTVDAANTVKQTITLDPTGSVDDVAIILMDSAGAQTAQTTLDTIMTSGVYGTGAQTTHGAWDVAEVAASVEDWLASQGLTNAAASIDANGHFNITLNDQSSYLSFVDQVSSTNGATPADAEIGFDSDGDGTIDETVSGFSNFFGLNDFFVDSQKSSVHETTVLGSTYTATATTLRFADGTSNLPLDPGGAGDVTITIAAGDSLQDIATNITNNVANVVADVVPDGAGFKLRISHSTGENLSITETGGGTLLSNIGMQVSTLSTAETIGVRSDIVASPSLISRGQVQWDASLGGAGQYYATQGDGTKATALAQAFLQANAFDSAGGITAISMNFTDYATTILSTNASDTAAIETQISYKTTLSEKIYNQSESVKGVNLDEEMSNLIIFEQAYSASARVMTVVQNMLDALESIIR